MASPTNIIIRSEIDRPLKISEADDNFKELRTLIEEFNDYTRADFFYTFNDRGIWKSNTFYDVKDLVRYNSVVYICLEAHTTTTIFDKNKWRLWQGKYVRNVNNIAELKDFGGFYEGDVASILNNIEGRNGRYLWVNTSTLVPNDLDVIKVDTLDTGRWIIEDLILFTKNYDLINNILGDTINSSLETPVYFDYLSNILGKVYEGTASQEEINLTSTIDEILGNIAESEKNTNISDVVIDNKHVIPSSLAVFNEFINMKKHIDNNIYQLNLILQDLDKKLSTYVSQQSGQSLSFESSLTVDGKNVTLHKGNGSSETIITQDTVYTLPVATSSTLGGIKEGGDISIDGGGFVQVNDNSHNHSIENITNLSTVLETFLPKSGGIMTDNILFNTTEKGIMWNLNSDYASIKFYNNGDTDTNCRLEFNIGDNNDEFFVFTHTSSGITHDLLKINPAAGIDGLTYKDAVVWTDDNVEMSDSISLASSITVASSAAVNALRISLGSAAYATLSSSKINTTEGRVPKIGDYMMTNTPSISDFTLGTLVTTSLSIPVTGDKNQAYRFEVTGKGYRLGVSHFFMVEGYFYQGDHLYTNGINFSGNVDTVKVFNKSGFVALWFPPTTYWNSFHITCYNTEGNDNINYTSTITNATMPTIGVSLVKDIRLIRTLNEKRGYGIGSDSLSVDSVIHNIDDYTHRSGVFYHPIDGVGIKPEPGYGYVTIYKESVGNSVVRQVYRPTLSTAVYERFCYNEVFSKWSNEIYDKVGVLTGAVMAFAQINSDPSGWVPAQGQQLSREVHSALFSVIGTTYGAGNGTTTYNVPDLRGIFIRGWDNGRGIDSGRGFSTLQQHSTEDLFTKFYYENAQDYNLGTVSTPTWQSNVRSDDNSGDAGYGFTMNNSSGLGIGAIGSGETRPINIALRYYIKL